MKKQIGSVLALYPTPLTVVGAMVASRPNWLLAGHLGIIGHDRVMVSLSDTTIPIAGFARPAPCPSILWTR